MDQQILFSTGSCVLGVLLVARSQHGVCAILLGDDADELERDLRARFSRDHLQESDAELAPLVSKVAAFLAAPGQGLDTPLDLRGSELERRVWNALREIPAGATETYSDVARRLGGAARQGSGRSLRGEPAAVAIPRHRVAAGQPGRLPLGLRRKRALPSANARLIAIDWDRSAPSSTRGAAR
jgi:AraC family transcriptional regulator of adaptative response/methylated-DNA-[protein]-cysteine methyltransferase